MNSKLKAVRYESKEESIIIAWLEDSYITIKMPTVTESKSYYPSYYRTLKDAISIDIENEHVFKYHLPKEFRE